MYVPALKYMALQCAEKRECVLALIVTSGT